jgi:hypothetical protein
MILKTGYSGANPAITAEPVLAEIGHSRNQNRPLQKARQSGDCRAWERKIQLRGNAMTHPYQTAVGVSVHK